MTISGETNELSALARVGLDPDLDSQILDQISDGLLITDLEVVIIWANTAATTMFGYDRAEFVGQSPSILHFPDDRETLTATIIASMQREGRWQGEIKFLRRDGSSGICETIVTPLTNSSGEIVATIGLNRDLSKQKEAEGSLKENEARYRSLLEAAPVCIHEIDRDGRLTSMNRAGLHMMGLAEESAVHGLRYLDIPIASDRSRIEALMNDAFQGSSSVFDFAAEGPDGLIYFQSCFAPIVDENGKIDRLMGITQDVTERRNAEIEKQRALESAWQADKAKSEFLATMSHELRTPLNAILGFGQMISNEVVGPIKEQKYLEYAADIESSGKHLLSIVNDLLDLSKIEAGEYNLDISRFALERALKDAASLVAFKSGRASERIRISVSDDAAELKADVRSFRQIMINLLSNADKYSPEDSDIWIKATTLEGHSILVEISDRALGIPEHEIDHVLEPFGQARLDHEVSHEGTGLGLSLSNQLMDLHGGSLKIKSASGRGTTVSLTFRIQRN